MTATSAETRFLVRHYFADLGHLRQLSREDELNLARRAACGCDDSRAELIGANLGFVVRIASEYRNLGLAFEDLLSEGNVGLVEAARRFDAERGARFITFAVWWIRKAILSALGRGSSAVRVPDYQRRRVRDIRATQSALREVLGREPRREEISSRLSTSRASIDRALLRDVRCCSLDQAIHAEGDLTLGEAIPDAAAVDAERELLRREAAKRVNAALRELPAQQRRVLDERFGLSGNRPLVLKEVGLRLGISRERVRQIESQAMQRLQRILRRGELPAEAAPGDRPFRMRRAV